MPTQRYSGGGRKDAKYGDTGGIYEVSAQGPRREQFRLFCILDNGTPQELARRGRSRPAIAVVGGLRKPRMTAFGEYVTNRCVGVDHRARSSKNQGMTGSASRG